MFMFLRITRMIIYQTRYACMFAVFRIENLTESIGLKLIYTAENPFSS